MGQTAKNERIRLKAGFFNSIAIGLFLTGCLLPLLAIAQRTGVIMDWLFNHSSREPVFVDYATVVAYFVEFALAFVGAGYFRRRADRMADQMQD
jgi:hypothetical protein